MRITIEGIHPTELFKLMEEYIKPSNIQFENREKLIKMWDEYKKDTLDKAKKDGVI